MNPSASRMRRHWQILCDQIGNRECGSDAEQKAADYIEAQFRRDGLDNVHQHRFEFPNSRSTKHDVYARQVTRW